MIVNGRVRRLKIRYLPIDDRNNLRVLRHTTDQDVVEAILGSIFKRPYYTLQVLWEYRKWFYELKDEQLERNHALKCGLIQICIMAGEIEKAEELIETLPDGTPHKAFSILMVPGVEQERLMRTMKEVRENGWVPHGPILTAGRPSLVNGAWDFTKHIGDSGEPDEETKEFLKLLFPEECENIYDMIKAETLYWHDDCYNSLVKTVANIPRLREREHIRLLFVALSLEMYILVLNGQASNSVALIDNLRKQISDNSLEEYTPNINALEAWAAMYDGDYTKVAAWMRDGAPDEYSKFCMLDLFRYMIKIRAYIISGKHLAVTSLAGRLVPLLEKGKRYMDLCETHLLWGMSDYDDGRLEDALYHIEKSLNLSEKYHYDRLIADEGKRALELIRLYEKEYGTTDYVKRVKKLTEKTSDIHPRYLKRQLPKKPALTETEMKVLRLLAEGGSNRDISLITGMAVETAKIHCKHIFEKLEVKNRQQAVIRAVEYGIIEPLEPGKMVPIL